MIVRELLETLQNAMVELKGRDVRNAGAVKLVDETAAQLSCITHPLSVHDGRLWYDTSCFAEIQIAEFKPQYSEDKRTCDGLGYRIRQMDVSLTRELPMELELSEINRWLQYAVAWERRQEALDNITRLEQHIAAERKNAGKMFNIMEQNQNAS